MLEMLNCPPIGKNPVLNTAATFRLNTQANNCVIDANYHWEKITDANN